MDIRWLLVLTLILIFLERLLFRRLALARLHYQRAYSRSVAQTGETMEMVEVIENRKWLPMPWIVLEATFDTRLEFQSQTDLNVRQTKQFQNHRSYFAMRPYTRITRRHSVRCLRRGVYPMGTAAMTCGDVFGLQSSVAEWKLQGEGTRLTVLPLVKPLEQWPLSTHSWQGDVVVRRWILPDPFIRAGSRPYQPGDPLNQVNWKATARTGGLQVHQQEFTADFKVYILLNLEVIENMWEQVTDPDRVEAGLVLAASIGSHFLDQGVAVGLACNAFAHDGNDMPPLPPVAGEAQRDRLLFALANVDIRVSRGFHQVLSDELTQGSSAVDYVVITGYVDDRLEDRLSNLRANGNSVQVVPLPEGDEVTEWLSLPQPEAEVKRVAG